MSPSPTDATKHRVNNPLPEEVDVAIVGCGIAGLTAGALLSQRGYRVALFDSHYVAGGCATQFARGGREQRYHFDVGLHYIGDCEPKGPIPLLLEQLGIAQEFIPMDQDGFDTYVFPDFEFRVPAHIERYRERLHEHFPREKKGIDRYVRLVREVMEVGQRIDAAGGKVGPRALVDLLLNGRLLICYEKATMADFLDTCTRDPQLRAVILGQHGDYALPPSEVSAMLHAGVAGHYFRGAYYPRGGGQIMSDKLALCIEDHGGSIHLRRAIARILVRNGRAVGVETEARKKDGQGQTVRAKVVISAADLKRTLLELVPPSALPKRWVERVSNYQMAGALFMTYLGVQGDMAKDFGMRAANYWQFDGYDFEADYQQARRSAAIEPRAAYITSASLKDPDCDQHAPAGITNVEVMTLVEGGPQKWGVPLGKIDGWRYKKDGSYQELKARVEQNMIDRLDRVFPGSAERIVFRESATPVSHARYTRSTAGSGYGIAATPAQFMKGRPDYEGPLQALFLCGMSTRAGHGIVGAMRGAEQCAHRVAQHLQPATSKR